MLKRVIAAGLSLMLLCGCKDSREPTELAYVQMMGLDGSGAALQILSVQGMSGGEDEGTPEFSVIYGEGETLSEMLREAELSSSKRLFLGHCRLIVLGTSADGYTESLSMLTEKNLISPACEIVLAAEPYSVAECETEERTVSADEVIDILDGYYRMGEIKKTTVAELFGGMARSGRSAAVPLVRAEKGRIYAVGTAAIRDDRYVGQLSRQASMGIALLCGKDSEPELTLSLENGSADLRLKKIGVSESAEKTADRYVFRPRIEVEAEILSTVGGIEKGLIEFALKNKLSDLIEAAAEESLLYGCDTLQLELSARKYCKFDKKKVSFSDILLRSNDKIAIQPSITCKIY